ncbi:hypothetical protein DFR58_11492 [Anaerobacterium chartisolvens]|uniref:Uncharacterized protein n=1 Tax=Anaerobacterium chartisolvens TaxID=1297424 RepID=A0A369B2Q7_9FIRM|nr:hypothetical protein [Anaerobacterium chartisolvens]RCX14858.1 hypothetical protein DFR58_11492 [Anaerobacterium chartisolvens]
MASFALFTFENRQANMPEKSLAGFISDKAGRLLLKFRNKEKAAKINLFDEVELCVVNAPYSVGEVLSGKKDMSPLIERVKARYNVDRCILPRSLCGRGGFGQGDTGYVFEFSGQTLYKALLVNIIKDVFNKKRKSICDLDITIVHQNNRDELYAIIEVLSPFVKYITVATGDKESIDDEIAQICCNTGLAIRVTSDYRSAVKSAELIINLAYSNRPSINIRTNFKQVVINYGDLGLEQVSGEGTVINGIDVCIPPKIACMLDKGLFDHYGKLELSEILLSHKSGCHERICGVLCDYELATRLAGEFYRNCYSICGYMGRHNMFKASAF